jgi:hypothetical protein
MRFAVSGVDCYPVNERTGLLLAVWGKGTAVQLTAVLGRWLRVDECHHDVCVVHCKGSRLSLARAKITDRPPLGFTCVLCSRVMLWIVVSFYYVARSLELHIVLLVHYQNSHKMSCAHPTLEHVTTTPSRLGVVAATLKRCLADIISLPIHRSAHLPSTDDHLSRTSS